MSYPTFGLNHNINTDSSVSNIRMQKAVDIGCKVVRTEQISATAMASLFNNYGIRSHPIIESTGSAITTYIASLYNADGTPKTGFCGVAELGPNEPYFNTGTSATAYYNSVHTGAKNAKAAHPNVKFVLNALWPGHATGSWGSSAMQEMLNAAASAGDDFKSIYYGWLFHPYLAPEGQTFPNSVYNLVSLMKGINTFLINNNMTSMPIWFNEWGFSTFASTQVNAVPNDSQQQLWISDCCTKIANPGASTAVGSAWASTIEGVFLFELQDNPGSSGNQEGHFGLIRSTSGDWSTGPTPSSELKPAYATYKSYIANSNSFGLNGDFTGTSGPPPPPVTSIALDASGNITNIPAGTARIHVGLCTDSLGSNPLFPGLGAGGDMLGPPFPASYNSPDVTHPWVEIQAWDSTNGIINSTVNGGWSTPFRNLPPPSGPSGTVIGLDSGGHILNIPANAARIHVGLATDVSGTGETFPGLVAGGDMTPAFPTTYHSNDGTHPWVRLQAWSSALDSAGVLAFGAANSGSVLGGTGVTVAATGFTQNRFLLAAVVAKGISTTATTVTTPGTGFGSPVLTQNFNNASGGAHSLYLFWKFAGVSEASTTWTFSQSANHIVGILAYDGVDPTTPLAALSPAANTLANTTTTIATPSITAIAGQMLIYGAGYTDGATTATYPATSPISTKRLDVTVDPSLTGIALSAGEQPVSVSAATGSRSITLSDLSGGAVDNGLGYAVLINPAVINADVNGGWSSPRANLPPPAANLITLDGSGNIGSVPAGTARIHVELSTSSGGANPIYPGLVPGGDMTLPLPSTYISNDITHPWVRLQAWDNTNTVINSGTNGGWSTPIVFLPPVLPLLALDADGNITNIPVNCTRIHVKLATDATGTDTVFPGSTPGGDMDGPPFPTTYRSSDANHPWVALQALDANGAVINATTNGGYTAFVNLPPITPAPIVIVTPTIVPSAFATINSVTAISPAPVISFTYAPQTAGSLSYTVNGNVYSTSVGKVNVNTAIQFTAVVQLTQGLTIREYRWTFSDGTSDSGPSIFHTFKAKSPVTRVSLTAIDNLGRKVSVGQQIYFN